MTDAETSSGSFGSITKLRQRNFHRRREADKLRARQGKSGFNQQYWDFAHELSSIVVTQALLLGPLERLKIVMQVNSLVKYANPVADKPKNLTDLCSKVTHS